MSDAKWKRISASCWILRHGSREVGRAQKSSDGASWHASRVDWPGGYIGECVSLRDARGVVERPDWAEPEAPHA